MEEYNKNREQRAKAIDNIDKAKFPITDELREIKRRKATGKVKDEETRKKISLTLKKYIKTETHKNRIAIAMYGKKHSPETIAKISATMKKRVAERPPMTRMTKFKIAERLREFHKWKKRAIAKRKEESSAERIARWEGRYKYDDLK